MSKRVVKKKKSAEENPPRVIPTAEIDNEANSAMHAGAKSEPPKMHAKTVQVIFSVGTYDRDQTIEDFIEDLKGRVQPLPYGEYMKGDFERQEGIHMTVTGAHYILDGKVCIPADYDSDTQNFKDGATPPVWAGGPTPKNRTITDQLDYDYKNLSKDEYDKKYGLGKYAKSEPALTVTPVAARKAATVQEDGELEEIDWDVEDLDDDDEMTAVSEATQKSAIKTLKKKRAIKKPAPKPETKAKRKIVRKK